MNKYLLILLPILSIACSLLSAPANVSHNNADDIKQAIPRVSAIVPMVVTKTPEMTEEMPARSFCTVTAESLHLRETPGERAAVAGYLLSKDLIYPTHTRSVGSWVEVQTQGGLIGWVNSKYIDCKKGS